MPVNKKDIPVQSTQVNAHTHQGFSIIQPQLLSDALLLTNAIQKELSNIEKSIKENGEKQTFKSIQKYLQNLHCIREKLPTEQENQLKIYFQQLINPITHQSELCKYCYDKPRGYAGDFIMMEMIWKGRTQPETFRYRGSTKKGQYINAFSLDSSNCIANCERVFKLLNMLQNYNPETVAAIGSGSVIELSLLFSSYRTQIQEVALFDQDQGALDLSAQRINAAGIQETIYSGNIFKSILKNKKKHDLVYSSGLLDYLDIKSSQKLLTKLWQSVKPGGHLIIVNSYTGNSTKLWMEYVAEWYLDHKSFHDFHTLVNQLQHLKSCVLDRDKQGIYQYYYLEKDTLN